MFFIPNSCAEIEKSTDFLESNTTHVNDKIKVITRKEISVWTYTAVNALI